MKYKIRILAIFLVMLTTFFLVELMSAGYFYLISKHYYRPAYLLSNNVLQWRTEFEPWGAWHLPNTIVRHQSPCFDVEYRSNSVGARDAEHSKKSPQRRAVFLGDSMTEGVGISQDKRFSDVVALLTGIESLNFGAGGHVGPVQYSILYRELAASFDHTDVVVGFFPFNDFSDNDPHYNRWERDDWRYRPYYEASAEGYRVFYKGKRIEGRSFADFNEAPRHRLGDYLWVGGLFASINNKLPPKSIDIDFDAAGIGYFETSQPRLTAAIHFLQEIIAAAENRQVWIVLLPSYSEAKVLRKTPSPWVEEFLHLLKNNRVRVIDLGEVFKQLDTPQLRRCYLDCDGHLSEWGNQLVAEVLAKEMRSQ